MENKKTKDNNGGSETMENYEPLEITVICFESEDVIVTSNGNSGGWDDNNG